MWGDKETTAPIPSVAPDGEQPFALTRNDSIRDINSQCQLSLRKMRLFLFSCLLNPFAKFFLIGS